jgi:hypothetical protein
MHGPLIIGSSGREPDSSPVSSCYWIWLVDPDYLCPRGGFLNEEAFGVYRELYPDRAAGVAPPYMANRPLDALGLDRYVEVGGFIAHFD